MPLVEDIQEILAQGLAKLQAAADADALEAWRIKYLGAKGAVKVALRRLKEVPRDRKRAAGQAANALKNTLTEAFERQLAGVAAAEGGSVKAAARPST